MIPTFMQSQGPIQIDADLSNLVALRSISAYQGTSHGNSTVDPIRKGKIKMMKAISFV